MDLRQRYIAAVKLDGPVGNKMRMLRNKGQALMSPEPTNAQVEKIQKIQAEQQRLARLIPNSLVYDVLRAESNDLGSFLDKLVREGGQAERNRQRRLKGKGDKLVYAESHGWSFRYKPLQRITEPMLYGHIAQLAKLHRLLANRNEALRKKSVYQRLVAKKTEENKRLNSEIAMLKKLLYH